MKKFSKYIYLFILSGYLFSCTDFLNEEPKSAISTDQFFSSKADAISAVNNLYRNGFPSFYNASSAYMGPTIMYGGYMSGLFDNQYKGQERFVQDCQNLDINPVADNNYLLSAWQNPYIGVTRANTAVKYIPTTPGLTADEVNKYLAEAKFFRALNYFQLVKLFGKVPLVKEPYESLSDLYVAPSSEEEIYNFIVEDLTFAFENGGLTDAPMPGKKPNNEYRISKGSVAALLADVYLNMSGYPVLANKYADAAGIAKYLITNPAYALIQNGATPEESAFNKLRTSDEQKEYLYVVEYDNSIANGGWRPTYCFPNEAASWGEFSYNITCLTYKPMPQLLTVYDKTNDLRIQEKQYFHTRYTYTKGPKAGQTIEFGAYYPYFWFESQALYTTAISSKDQVHYRLSEMYLLAAEAIAQTSGVTAEAAGYLAEIKARASMNKTKEQITSELMALSKDNFIHEVWTEKIRELIFENKIWNDITRTRMYPAVSGETITFVPLIGAVNPWGKSFAEKDLVLPYPNDEVQRNPKLKGN